MLQNRPSLGIKILRERYMLSVEFSAHFDEHAIGNAINVTKVKSRKLKAKVKSLKA
jgi:hypothetical protein